MSYLLDTNIFIEANNRYYGLDFCPAFWDWLIEQNQTKKVFSIEKVSDEIQAGNDHLSDWAKAIDHNFFLRSDEEALKNMRRISQWVTNKNYQSAAISSFFSKADYYLVAHAMENGHTVVTHEVASESFKSIKIPDVCKGMGVKFMSPFEMLRHEQACFVLKSIP